MSGIFTNVLSSLPGVGLLFNNGFRPPNWSYGPQTVSVTANIPTSAVSTAVDTKNILPPISGGLPPDVLTPTMGTGSVPISQNNVTSFVVKTYFFDAVIRLHHEQRLHATEHPIQNGAMISDHAYILPARVSLEVEISDAMDSFVSGQYGGQASKSVAAYQTFKKLRDLRIPLSLTTKLDNYDGMLIEELISDEDARTQFSWKGRLVMRQIFMATVSSQPLSARPNQSVETNPGASTPQPVPQNILQNYMDPVTGAWSSNPTIR